MRSNSDIGIWPYLRAVLALVWALSIIVIISHDIVNFPAVGDMSVY